MQAKVIFLDNFDSFTYNIVDQIRSLNYQVEVYNNTVDVQQFSKICSQEPNTILILGPGPGTPQESGNLMQIIAELFQKLPILGICLGHQALCAYLGANIVRTNSLLHGKTSEITHNNQHMYKELPNPLTVARYHSLMAVDLPDCIEVNAQVDNIVMSFLHKELAIAGFQFHPESIMTVYGVSLLKQSIDFLINYKGIEHNG